MTLSSNAIIILPFILLLLAALLTIPQVEAFTAFVSPHDPVLQYVKPLNMTRKASPPPRAAWQQMDDSLLLLEEVVQVVWGEPIVTTEVYHGYEPISHEAFTWTRANHTPKTISRDALNVDRLSATISHRRRSPILTSRTISSSYLLCGWAYLAHRIFLQALLDEHSTLATPNSDWIGPSPRWRGNVYSE